MAKPMANLWFLLFLHLTIVSRSTSLLCETVISPNYNGTIESPGFPREYYRDKNCLYTFSLWSSYSTWQITFTYFNFPNTSCDSDYIELYNNSQYQRYCYNSTPPPDLRDIYTLRFVSSVNASAGFGFQARVSEILKIPEDRGVYLTTPVGTSYPIVYTNAASAFQNSCDTAFTNVFKNVQNFNFLKTLQLRSGSSGQTVVVYVIYFTTTVTNSTLKGVALTVLGIERAGYLAIGTSTYQIALYTGIFLSSSRTSNSADDFNWCCDVSLYSCTGETTRCVDGGLRYTCNCKLGSVSFNGQCIDEREIQYDMYPYGYSNGDTLLQEGDDETFRIEVPSGIPYGDRAYYSFYLGINGLVTFEDRDSGLSASLYNYIKMFSAYQADIITRNGNGYIWYQIYSRRQQQRTVFDKAEREVTEFLDVSKFKAKLVIVITWDRVSHYSNQYTPNNRVTFQTIFVSDGEMSYALVYYKNDSMSWDPRVTTRVVMGYSDGKGRANSVKQSPYSYTTMAISSIGTLKGNTKRRGMWAYKVGEKYSPDQICNDWYQTNYFERYLYSFLDNWIPRCPCSSNQLGLSWSYNRYIPELNADCYTLDFSTGWRYYPYGRECCYSLRGWLWTWVQGLPYAGSIVTYNPIYYENVQLNKQYDRDPHDVCCGPSSTISSCMKYYELRPIGWCNPFPTFFRAWSWGDPHILTLDGKEYTFNGWGEYNMLKIQTKNVTFNLQCRTDRVLTENGTQTDATIFSAFAMAENGVRVFVQLDPNDNQSLVIYANGTDQSRGFREQANFTMQTTAFALRKTNSSLAISFGNSGIGITITPAIKALDISVNMPVTFRNQTKGLLGNYNNDPSDDFTLPNGTVLPSNISDRQKFEHFGIHWSISPNESLFMYDNRLGPANYSHPEFEPIFLDEVSGEQLNASYKACGGADKLACVYDYLVTGNKQVAEASKQVQSTASDTNTANKNTVPELKSTGTVNATSTVLVTFQLIGEDKDSDAITYHVAEGSRGNVSINSTSGTVTYTPSIDHPASLGFYVVDSKNAASPVVVVPVAYCTGCSDNGVCDYNNLRNGSTQTFQIASCVCHVAWTGEECDQDRDACLENPCVSGQNCTDLTPEQQGDSQIGYNCSHCPRGYEVNTTTNKCQDIDECFMTNMCGQICSNTEGSYLCSCHPGYRLGVDRLSCLDINECAEKTDGCSQICTNYPGGFNCSCYPGYGYQELNKTCVQDTHTAATCSSFNCTQGCQMVNEAPECFCSQGYVLSGDNKTCDDMDECTQDVCTQECNNAVGSFTCTCYVGYQLDSDKTTCNECPDMYYGLDCSQVCDCNGRQTGCDNVKGCICDIGWTGSFCEEDRNECVENANICNNSREVCVNTNGSYRCDCQSGYTRGSDQLCIDINECDPLLGLSTCNTLEDCFNTNGSYYCTCKSGYQKENENSNCTDIDECGSSDLCDQECVNTPGGYNCRCHYGYRLAVDRVNCVQVENLCKDEEGLICEHGCTMTDTNRAMCFCRSGYRLAPDGQRCPDVDECVTNNGGCSHTCTNTPGSFHCSCPIGHRMGNDRKTCLVCGAGTYGENCADDCACGPGADRCDSISGCVCNFGYTGDKCDQDVDECHILSIVQDCESKNAHCTNFIGRYSCDCDSGYRKNTNGTCEDVDECLATPCSQMCENFAGGYRCRCNRGFSINQNGTCQDQDECSMSTTNRCQQQCINTIGSYRCYCNQSGYELDNDGYTCTARTFCNENNTCPSQNGGCSIVNGTDTCFCNSGYDYNQTANTCTEQVRNWCALAGCQQNCTEIPELPRFRCHCRDGYLLNDDRKTCRVCTIGTYGNNCSSTCTCATHNTINCSNVDGNCTCKSGWKGRNCDKDIDECAQSPPPSCGFMSECVNTNGSFICVCDPGYQRLADGSCAECTGNRYGDNCGNQCKCNVSYTVSCHHVTGNCTCKPGWTGNTCDNDIDECTSQTHNCTGLQETCSNTPGGYSCACNDGYQYYNASRVCVACDMTLQTSNGWIQSPSFPAGYLDNMNCFYVIQTPNNQTGFFITFTFSSFDLQEPDSKGSCIYDYLEIHQVPWKNWGYFTPPDAKKFCGRGPTQSLTTYFPTTLHFVTDGNITKGGFNISFVQTMAGCGETLFVGEEGFLFSPNHPGTFPTNLNCTTTIRVRPGHNITLTFHSFFLGDFLPMDNRSDCWRQSQSVLEIYDNISSGSELIGIYCGYELPRPITSTSNELTLIFRSSSNDYATGYNATYVSTSTMAEMTSPATTATPLQNCEMPRLNLQESCGNDSKTWGYCYRENTACVYPKTRWDYGERTCQCVHGTVMVVDDASNFTCVDIYQLFRENISRQLASDVEPNAEVYSGSLTFNDLETTRAQVKYSLYPSDSWLSVTKNGLNFSVITNKRLPQANAVYFFVLRVDVDSYNYSLHLTDTTTLNITVIHTFLKASEVGVFLLDGSRKGTIVYDVTSALGSIDNTELKLQTDTAVTLFELQSNRRIVCVKDVDINSIRISSDAIGHVVTLSLTSSGQVVLVVKVAVIVASTRLTIPENNLPNKNVVTFSSLRESFDIAEQHRPVDLPLILTPNRTAIQLTRGLDFEKDPKSFQITVSLQFRPNALVSTSVSITVDVTDINDSPPRFLQNVYIIIAPYCSENGTLLGQLAVEDQDSMTQTFSFQIVPSRNSSLFRIRDSAGILEATKKLPEDAGANGIVINVIVSDGVNTSPTPTTVIIYVSRYIQEFELVGGNYSLSIVENIPVGTEVFNASLTNYTGYQLLPASVLYFFTINQTTGIIRTRSEIDREGRVPQENMNVVAFQQNDVCKLKTVSNITLTILDENDNPPVFDTSVTYAVSIAENSANGAFVFKFSATDKDYKENATLTYSITSGNSPFRIDSVTGNVTVADSSRLDREVLDTLRLVVTVVDGGTTLPQNLRKSASINFTVTLTDVNDNDPIFNQNVYTVSVYENISVNSNLTVVRATDRDIDFNGQVRYSLGDGVGIGSFAIDYTTGQLRNRMALDREQYESFTFTVIASDLGSPPRSSSATVVVKVLDVNDNIPQFQKAVYLPSPIDEGISCWNKSFVTVTAEDKDSGLNSEIVYSIESDLLVINSSTGEVTCKAAGLDYENVTQRTFDVVVRASDKGTPPLTSTSVIRVTVRDVNDNPPVFMNSPYNISVRVEAFNTLDSPIFVFSVQDKDSGENSEVDLRLTNPSPEGAGLLTVSNLVLRVNRTGRPSLKTFSYIVIATDRGRLPLSSSASVYIYISDFGASFVNFKPKDFLFKIVEEKSYDESSGIAIGKLTMTNESSPPVFSLVGASSFSVNNSTGHLFTSKVWDRERDRDSAELTIMAKASFGADVDYALVKITLLDINDNSPSILTNPSALVGSVYEDANDTFIISLEATDPDEGPNGTVIFSMEGGMPFRIETANTTGKIFVNGSLDRELKNEYVFTVWVRDNAKEPRSVSVSVTILIDDINDNAPTFVNMDPIFVPENTSSFTNVGMVSATDPDQGRNGMVTYSIDNSSACPLKIREDDGTLLLIEALDYETVKNYTCIIEASDQGDIRLSSTANFTILVTDINDNAPVIHNAVSSVNVTRDIEQEYVLVESLNVTDVDSVSKGAISFHFVDPANPTVPVDKDTVIHSYFNINPTTGAISMKSSIRNFPEDDVMLTIAAKDEPPNQPTLWSNPIQIQVHILDASSKPQFNRIDSINITEGPLTLPRVLTRVSAFVYENKVRVDPCNCSYSINNTELGNGSSLKGTFSINALSGEITLNASLDREATGNIIFLTLFASDFGSPPKTGSATLNVSVVDINDNIPKFSTDSYQITVTESSCSEGQVLYNITAHDADEPPNNIIVYSLRQLSPDTPLVKIDNSSGQLSPVTSLCLNDTVITAIATATDLMDSDKHSFVPLKISVKVNDPNPNAPEFLKNMYQINLTLTVTTDTIFTIPDFEAKDKDKAQNITYSIESGNCLDLFELNNQTREFKLKHPNCTTTIPPMVNLSVKATDSGDFPLNFRKSGNTMVQIKIFEENKQCDNWNPSALNSATEKFKLFMGLFIAVIILLAIAIIICVIFIYKWKTAVSGSSPITAPEVTPYKHSLMEPRFTKISKKKSVDTPGFPPNLPKRSNAGLSSGPEDSADSGVSSQWIPSDQSLDSAGYLAPSDRQYSWEEEGQGSLGDEDPPGRTSYLTVIPDPNGHQSDNPGVDDLASPQFVHVQLDSNPPPCEPKHGTYLRATKESPKSRDTYLHPTQVSQPAFPPSPPREDDVPPEAFIRPSPLGILYRPRDSPTGLNRQGFGVPSPGHVQAQEGHDPYILREGRGSSQT